MHHETHHTIATALFLLLCLLVAGCTTTGNAIIHEGNIHEGNNAIKIGVLTPLTGSAAPYGEPTRDGLLLALHEINGAGGIGGRQVELIIEDSACDGQQAATATQKLIEIDAVHVLIGGVCSSVSLAAAPLTETAGVLQVAPGSSAPSVTDTHVIRLYASDAYQAKGAAAHVTELGYKQLGILYIDDDYGVGLRDALIAALGNEVVVTGAHAIDANGRDFRTAILKVMEQEPDALYVIGFIQETGTIAKQLRELGYDTPIIGTESLESEELFSVGGGAVEGIEFITPVQATGPSVTAFEDAFVTYYGREPLYMADYGYDALMVVAEALANTDGSYHATRDYLVENEFVGATGPIDFDENGDVMRDWEVVRVENQGFVRVG